MLAPLLAWGASCSVETSAIRSARWVRPVSTSVAAILTTALVATIGLAAAGFDPAAAGVALVDGAIGSFDRFTSISLVRATPLILTGLAVAIAFRAGVWNIGAEGQLYAGAVAAAWLGLSFPQAPAWILLPATM